MCCAAACQYHKPPCINVCKVDLSKNMASVRLSISQRPLKQCIGPYAQPSKAQALGLLCTQDVDSSHVANAEHLTPIRHAHTMPQNTIIVIECGWSFPPSHTMRLNSPQQFATRIVSLSYCWCCGSLASLASCTGACLPATHRN